MNRLFSFKQFSLSDQGAAMKIGTDAVLLGAWTSTTNATNILDIGTGCGILALMLAQRSSATVMAIEPAESAYFQAQQNFQNSPWHHRIQIMQTRVQDFFPTDTYDLIVCNPPFFQQSLLGPDEGRNLARHNTDLSLQELIESVVRLGKPDFTFSLILPAEQAHVCEEIAEAQALYCCRKLNIRTFQHTPYVRVLMEFSRSPMETIVDEMVLRNIDGSYSPHYQRLTKPFHPHF